MGDERRRKRTPASYARVTAICVDLALDCVEADILQEFETATDECVAALLSVLNKLKRVGSLPISKVARSLAKLHTEIRPPRLRSMTPRGTAPRPKAEVTQGDLGTLTSRDPRSAIGMNPLHGD
jgi:hypothetical protein